MRLGRLLAVAAAGLLLAPAIAVAQSSIGGAVTDDTGGVLPGVTVEASSDVLIEGSRVVFTDGTGQYNIIDLRPGEYTVTFTLPGFGTQVRDQLILGADVALPIDVIMAVGSVEETITVSGETPVVDVQQVQRVEVMTRETQEAIPTGRSTWSYALLIPGVKARAPDMGGTAGAQQSEMMGRGLDASHTTVEIDGMMINTLISDGRYQAYMNPMMAAETSYTTSGQGAETQNGGLRINMIPNEGGNQFSGNMFAGGTPGAWQADNLNPRLQDLGVQETPKVSLIYDFNGSFGGPVFRDRLWFFSSARRNVIDDGVLNSYERDGSAALDRNSITSANARLTWQMNQQNKISVMFDKVRKRRFSEHQPNDDFETAAQSWTSPHYDTGTAKWTGTLSNRMLAEFGFSLVYEDWDPGYYRFSSVGDYDYFSQVKPDGAGLAYCNPTPCYDAPGSTAYLAQTTPWSPSSPTWFNMAPRWDAHLGMNYHVADDDEQNNYSHRWAYQGAVSYVTGSHSFKFGTNFSYGQNRHTRTGNADLQQRYDDSPNLWGHTLDFVNAGHWANEANTALGLPAGTTGAAEFVRVKNYPEFRAYNLDFNGGIYAQDSWTIDRLTLNYGLRVDWSRVSIPETPKGPGRFTPATTRGGVPSSDLPAWGPDFSPRLSIAYDVFGDARTALKFSYNKYVRDVGTGLPSRYQYGGAREDTREWYDCALDPATLDTSPACATAGSDLYMMYLSSMNDHIAQNWEIGPPNSAAFGEFTIASARPDLNNFPREYNHIWTAGIQQEIFPGLSLSGEYRRRYFRNTFSRDNEDLTFASFGANPDGSPNPAYAGTRHIQVARPYPMTGSFTLFGLDPDLRGVDDNIWERQMVDGYSNIYHGFELSAQGRLAGGGTLFGGWSMEDTGRTTIYGFDSTAGGGSYGGETNLCADVMHRGDNPNEMRFCDQRSFPRPFRHEFKLSGTQPFTLPGLGDMQFGASLQAYPGGGNIRWGAFQEGLNVRRYSGDPNELLGTYSEQLYGQPGHCVAPCVVGERFVPDSMPVVNTSTTGYWVPMVPLASVKFLPYWTQLDMNFLKVFNVGSWRYEARWEFFNMLNNGVELESQFNHSGSTGAGYQSLAGWERASRLLPGRVIRFAVTARF